MRRLLTVLLVVGVAAIALVAVGDTFRGSSSSPPARDRTTTTSPETRTISVPEPAALPRCFPEQLSLSLEPLDGVNFVVLRHAQGDACRLDTLTLRVTVIDRHGRRNRVGLAEARELGDDYLPGSERSVSFSICGEGAPFVAEARAGPHSARGAAFVGGPNCASAVRRRVLRLRADEARTAKVEALDPATHPLTVRVDLPHRADVDVWLKDSAGHTIEVLSRDRRAGCERRGARDVCLVRYPLLPAHPAGVWTLWAQKPSGGPAVLRVTVTFEDPLAQ